MSAELEAAFGELLERIRRAEAELRTSPAFGTDAEQAAGYQHIARSIRKGIEGALLQEVDFPYFRILDFWQREGGDNPDQCYAFSPIRGGVHYRIRGTLGSACRVELQLYAGEPWAQAGRSVGYLAFEQIEVDDHGRFVIELTPEPVEGSWVENPPDATTVFVRHIYDEWDDADPGDVHIDRVGMEGARHPLTSTDEMAERFHDAAHMIEQAVTAWPEFVQARYVEPRPPNQVSALIDTYAMGGVAGRWMASGRFELAPGMALVVTTWPTDAAYQAIQLTDMWFASLEYANLTSSLTTRQSVRSTDGAFHSVISADDPGHANWLDTGGHTRGVFLLRYDGVEGTIDPEAHPSAELVALADLAAHIPGFRSVGPDERARQRAARRRHLQTRVHR